MSDNDNGWAWFDETLNAGYQFGLKVDSILFRETTEHQDLVIYQTSEWGRIMALDGIIQVCERDEFIYHEMLTHVPLFAHGAAREVCVVGGGDGGMLREALKHPVDRVTMVEIDGSVVELCKEYLPSISDGAFDDPRADLVIADGAAFMAETDRSFDVIIIDSTDPIGPGEVLFSSAFYADCKARLNPGGVMTTQSGVVMIQGDELTTTVQRLGAHFADAFAYIAPVPTYAGGFMAFGWGTDNTTLRSVPADTLAVRYDQADITTRYYNPSLHGGAFAHPTYVAELLEAGRETRS
ncbi:MAG: polyamine aminopropyltransferase [Alphaproteobacteria bacterium]|nr:polyamine aminopropyltransferase [Alphaproteobacteria bacterium]